MWLLVTGMQVVLLPPRLLFLFFQCPGAFAAIARAIAIAHLAALLPDNHTAFGVVREPAGLTLERQHLKWEEHVWVTGNDSTGKAAEQCRGLGIVGP